MSVKKIDINKQAIKKANKTKLMKLPPQLGRYRLKPERTVSTGMYSEKVFKKCQKNRLRTRSGPCKEIAGGR